MPEELGIALLVLFVVGWGLFKLLAFVFKILDDATKEFSNWQNKKATDRLAKKRKTFEKHVRVVVPDELGSAQRELDGLRNQFKEAQRIKSWAPVRPSWPKVDFLSCPPPMQADAANVIDIGDLNLILRPNDKAWSETEAALIRRDSAYPFPPPKFVAGGGFTNLPIKNPALQIAKFELDQAVAGNKDISILFSAEQGLADSYNRTRKVILSEFETLNTQITEWNTRKQLEWDEYVKTSEIVTQEEANKFKAHAALYAKECQDEKARFKTILDGFRQANKESVLARISYIVGGLRLPQSVPRRWEADFDEEQRILIIEIGLPDVVHNPPVKTALLKSGRTIKPLNQTEKKEQAPKIHPAIMLRIAYEIVRNDDAGVIRLLVINGWVKYHHPSTGVLTKSYTASLMVEPSKIQNLNLETVDPLVAFQSLSGKSAGKLIEIIPIEPTLNLNRTDSRFVEAREVLNTLDESTNLAAMDWQEFEHLIRELFEKEFAGRGAEVKITQASRDRGVDAIAFNPDPIHGGKYVIQAKRYTNTVDVSAVRDLCAVVHKEGASRGILVTTSVYGADAYAFVENQPITLLNGSQLLGLLQKHGYSFKIDLEQARRLRIDL